MANETEDLFILTVTKHGLAILLAALTVFKAQEGHLLKSAERAALEEMIYGVRQGMKEEDA